MRRKVGPHCLGWTTDAERLGRAGVAVAKFAGLFDGAAELAALPAETRPGLRIGRVVEEEFGIDERRSASPVDYARYYFARYLEKPIQANPALNAWEGPNEPTANNAEGMRWYAEFLYELARLIRGTGKTPISGNWSVGTPDYGLWPEYRQALQAVRDHGAVLGRHSYAGPDQSTWPYLLLRHREDNARFEALGFGDVPVVLTEAGADSVPFGMPPGTAWRDLYGDDGARYVREILAPLEMELRRDEYVIGAVLFTYGPREWWPRHNVDGSGVTEALLALPPPQERDDMNRDALLTALAAQQASVRDHLTSAFNHITEIGKLVDQLTALEPPPPVRPWWELLPEPITGAPKAKVYAVENHLTHSSIVPVYKSDAKNKAPSFTDLDTRTKQRGEHVEVWHAVVPGSKWICVFDGNVVGGAASGRVLWVWAFDVAKDQPGAE